MDLKTLGSNIASIRKRYHLTQENVATDLGISITAYTNIEHGASNISFLRIVQLAEYFKVEISDIIYHHEQGACIQTIASDISKMKEDIQAIKEKLDR